MMTVAKQSLALLPPSPPLHFLISFHDTTQRKDFEAWITQCESQGKPLTSPMTRQPVSPIWFPNRSIRARVEEYVLSRIKEEDGNNA